MLVTSQNPLADERPEVDGLVPPVGDPVAREAHDRLLPGDRARSDKRRNHPVDGDAQHKPAKTTRIMHRQQHDERVGHRKHQEVKQQRSHDQKRGRGLYDVTAVGLEILEEPRRPAPHLLRVHLEVSGS
jgi:hypothetical protein